MYWIVMVSDIYKKKCDSIFVGNTLTVIKHGRIQTINFGDEFFTRLSNRSILF